MGRNMEVKYRPELFFELIKIKEETLMDYLIYPVSFGVEALGIINKISDEKQSELEKYAKRIKKNFIESGQKFSEELNKSEFIKKYGFEFPGYFLCVNLLFFVISLNIEEKRLKLDTTGFSDCEILLINEFFYKMKMPCRNINLKGKEGKLCYYELNPSHSFENDLKNQLEYIKEQCSIIELFNIKDEVL